MRQGGTPRIIATSAVRLGAITCDPTALERAALDALDAGDPQCALRLSDRLCRIHPRPGARHYVLRARASLALGAADWAEQDFAQALRVDPLSVELNAALLCAVNGDDVRLAAAQRLLGSSACDEALLRQAADVLRACGKNGFARLEFNDGVLRGVALWSEGDAAALHLATSSETVCVPLADDATLPQRALFGRACEIERRRDDAGSIAYRLTSCEQTLAAGRLWPRRLDAPPPEPPPRRAPTTIPALRPLRIIVPVYDDLLTTRACIVAALTEARHLGDARIIVVDDASPQPDVVRMLDDFARQGWIELRRNADNRGFVGAIGRGLEDHGDCDALLLNADAVLAADSLRRLRQAVYSAADVGAAAPFSNNGEFTSFPLHAVANPASERTLEIDRIAARVNAGRIVDIPCGTGFCLYIRHDCLAAVGGLSEVYYRGYLEDVEFAARTRRAGFRNVCAASVYVVHFGTLSFKSDKRELVVRNLDVFRQRFPGYEAECEAYLRDDPLRAARAAIESELAPADAPTLIVARFGSSAAAERLRRLEAAGETPLLMSWGGPQGIALRRAGGDWPQSLRWACDPDSSDALAAYFRRASVKGLEVAGPLAPAFLVDVLRGLDVDARVLMGDFGSDARGAQQGSPLVDVFDDWRRALPARLRGAIVLDAVGAAAMAHARPSVDVIVDRPPPAVFASPAGTRKPTQTPVIGVLAPAPHPTVDGFLRALAAELRRDAAPFQLVALGRAADENALMSEPEIFVTGAIAPGEYSRLVAQYSVGVLTLAPSCDAFGLFEALISACGVQGVGFDWSFGTASRADLAYLDPRLDFAATIRELAAMLRLASAGSRTPAPHA
jgi:GT2 family glycosyltransferase